jgi:hypothetical protein
MFEGQDKFCKVNNNAQSIRDYTIIHTCRKCKKKLPTLWNKNNEIEGAYLADDAMYSEYLDICVSWPDGIVCYECLYGL